MNFNSEETLRPKKAAKRAEESALDEGSNYTLEYLREEVERLNAETRRLENEVRDANEEKADTEDELKSARKLLDEMTSDDEREERNAKIADNKIAFLKKVLGVFGLDTEAFKAIGGMIVRAVAASSARDNALEDESRRLTQLRQLEIDLRYAGRQDAADKVALEIASALVGKLGG